MENEKRKSKTNKLTHKQSIIQRTQLLFKVQEECNSLYVFFLTSKSFNYLILFSGLWFKNFFRVLPAYLVIYYADKLIESVL